MSSQALKDRLGPAVKENIVIRDYVATAVGGIVDYLVVCETIEQLIQAVRAALELEMPYVVIGQGSNVLFSDIGFPGLVIINRTTTISVIPDKSQVIADSGVLLSRLIMEVASRDLTGLEFLFGLRGTIGGAAVNNRQANGVAFSKVIKALTVLMPNGAIVHQPAEWMEFQPYRSLIMAARSHEPRSPLPVILTVSLQLSRNKKEEILRKIQHFGSYNKRLWPLEEPSIGPIFCDPSAEQPAEDFLQDLKLKKTKVGRARIFPRQPNFILTHERGLGPGKTADIYQLVKLMQQKAYEAHGQRLVEAFEYFGSWDFSGEMIDDSLIEYE